MPGAAHAGFAAAHVVEVDDERDRHLHAVGALAAALLERRDRRGDAVVREARRDRDHRQAAERRRELRDVERAPAADPDERVVEARAQPLGERVRLVDAAVGDASRCRRSRARAAASRRSPRPARGRRRRRRGRRRRCAGRRAAGRAARRSRGRCRRTAAPRSSASAAASDLPCAREVGVVVDLGPVDRADRRDADPAAAVGVLLVAVLVVELRVALERRLSAAASGPAAAGSISVSPMYSPWEAAGSSALLMRVMRPSPASCTFISSSPSGLTSSSASRMSGPRAASSVCSTLGGCTVSPLISSTPAGEEVARAPQRVGVVPDLGLVVEDELQRDAVVALERRLALLDRRRGVAGDDRDVVEPGRLQVRQRDVEDRPVAVDGHERLGQRVGVRREAPARSRREHHPDHSPSSSSSS